MIDCANPSILYTVFPQHDKMRHKWELTDETILYPSDLKDTLLFLFGTSNIYFHKYTNKAGLAKQFLYSPSALAPLSDKIIKKTLEQIYFTDADLVVRPWKYHFDTMIVQFSVKKGRNENIPICMFNSLFMATNVRVDLERTTKDRTVEKIYSFQQKMQAFSRKDDKFIPNLYLAARELDVADISRICNNFFTFSEGNAATSLGQIQQSLDYIRDAFKRIKSSGDYSPPQDCFGILLFFNRWYSFLIMVSYLINVPQTTSSLSSSSSSSSSSS